MELEALERQKALKDQKRSLNASSKNSKKSKNKPKKNKENQNCKDDDASLPNTRDSNIALMKGPPTNGSSQNAPSKPLLQPEANQ